MTDLMKTLEGIEQSALNELSKAGKLGEGVELPFAAAYFWAMNGQRNMAAIAKECAPLYFGGFATDADKFMALEIETPSGLNAFTGSSDRGEWNGLATRVLHFALIGKRTRWLSKDGSFSTHYKDTHTRQHIQVLGLGYANGKPWIPVVVSAKGYQAKHIIESVKAWEKAIAPFKKELNATQFPISCFVISIGTQGDKPEFVNVGQTGAQSSITPIRAVSTDGMTAEKVSKRFIGPDVLRANAERLAQAADWLKAWHESAENGSRNAYVPEPDIPIDEPF